MRSFLAGLVVVPALVVGLGVTSPASALSCVGPTAVLERAETIYAGRIVDSSDDEVTFEIDEVWRGTPPPARVTYDIGLPDWWEADQVGKRGDRFVIAPGEGAVNPCTVFARGGEMADEIEAFRPATPGSPMEGAVIDEDPPAQPVVPGWALVAGGAGLLLVGVLLWAVRRRRA